jgi:hypothetical protein
MEAQVITVKGLIAMGCVLALGLLASASAFAVKPTREPVVPSSVVLPAGEACSFPLSWVESGGDKRTRTTFYDREGNPVRVQNTGPRVTITLTNIDTGKSITLDHGGGTVQETLHADGSVTDVLTGSQSVLSLFPTDVPAGPSTTIYYGRVVFEIAPDGTFTLVSTSGRSVDACAALSG